MRQELNNMKQTASESYLSFFRRVISVYYRARGTFQIPEIDKISDSHEQSDIKYHFLQGLRNKQVRKLCKTNASAIEFKELGRQSQIYSHTEEEDETASVNMMSSKKMETEARLNEELINFMRNMTVKNQRKPFDKSRIKCFRCGYFGHFADECEASERTLRARNKSVERNRNRSQSRERGRTRFYVNRSRSNSRGRGRDSSRDRGRRHDTPYRSYNRRPYSRSGSRGRSFERNSREEKWKKGYRDRSRTRSNDRKYEKINNITRHEDE